MTYNQLIIYISGWIKTNHNEEITGAILQDVLKVMVQYVKDYDDEIIVYIQDLQNQIDNITIGGGVTAHEGTQDPNLIPPTDPFVVGDLFIDTQRNDVYIYNGLDWTNVSDIPEINAVINEIYIDEDLSKAQLVTYINEKTPPYEKDKNENWVISEKGGDTYLLAGVGHGLIGLNQIQISEANLIPLNVGSSTTPTLQEVIDSTGANLSVEFESGAILSDDGNTFFLTPADTGSLEIGSGDTFTFDKDRISAKLEGRDGLDGEVVGIVTGGKLGWVDADGGNGDRYKTTSTTSNTISKGVKTFTVELGLSYIPHQDILVAHDSTNYMNGHVVSYNEATGAFVVDVKKKKGSGTFAEWDVNLGGVIGGVISVTGDGVGGTPEDVVMTFPTASQIGALTSIDDKSITFPKIQDVPTNTMLGRVDEGTGAVKALTKAEARFLLGVTDSPDTTMTNVAAGGSIIAQPTPTNFLNFTNQTTPVILSGLSGGINGKEITIWNNSVQALELLNDSPSAVAANRVKTLGEKDISIPVDAKTVLRYTGDEWTMIGVFGAGYEPTLIGAGTRAVTTTADGVLTDEEIFNMKVWNFNITTNQTNLDMNDSYPDATQGFIVVAPENNREYEMFDENLKLWNYKTITKLT